MHIEIFLTIIVLAFFCECIDSAQGGGYGTILAPILIMMDLEYMDIILSIILTEIFSGFGSSFLHHKFNNAKFHLRNNGELDISEDSKTVLILSFFSVLGGFVAIVFNLNLPKIWIKTYIGLIIISIGFLTTINFKWNFSWKKMYILGSVAGLNKGISGGGYGPLVTSGQIISNRDSKQAIASTSFSEAIVCLTTFIMYLLLGYYIINTSLLFALCFGSLLAVPLATYLVKYLSSEKLKPAIGVSCIILGSFTILKLILL